MLVIPERLAWSRKATVAIGAFFIVTSAAIVPAMAAVDAGTAPTIVGMGDSYTSGLGVRPYVGNAKCYRSASAYPLLAANDLGYAGRNVACAGADTQDVATDYNGESSQIGQLNDPDWVVMTVGSNNANLSGAILQDEVSATTVLSRIPKVSKAVENTLVSVQKAAPNAEVILVNHPDVLPESTAALSCLGDKASKVDLVNMHKAFTQFNAALKTAAMNAKAIYVDTAPVFAGHDVCASDSWFTGIDDADAPFHLNLAGNQQVANLVVAAIKKVDGAVADPVASTSTSAPPTTAVSTTTVPPTTVSTTSVEEPATTTTTSVVIEDPSDLVDPVTTLPHSTVVVPNLKSIVPVASTVMTSRERPVVTTTTKASTNVPAGKASKKSKWAKRHHCRHHCLGHRQRQWSFIQQTA